MLTGPHISGREDDGFTELDAADAF